MHAFAIDMAFQTAATVCEAFSSYLRSESGQKLSQIATTMHHGDRCQRGSRTIDCVC